MREREREDGHDEISRRDEMRREKRETGNKELAAIMWLLLVINN